MADPLPPDPYEALGVAKDAPVAAIKAQYRKLALKFHPDKVKDEAAKGEASDRFHKIQSAWEIVGDEARRARYDATIKLHELRKDVFAAHGGQGSRRGGDTDVRTASYKMPTESARGGDFYARGPERYGPKASPQYEEHRPSYASDDYFEEPSRPNARKYDDYERSSKRASPREDRERARARETERSSRKEKSRRTEKDVRRDRDRKQAYVEVQEEYEIPDEFERPQRTPPGDEYLQRARADFFSRDDPFAREAAGNYDDRSRKTFQHLEEAKAHMERQRTATRARGESEPRNLSPGDRRPSPQRMASSSSKEKAKRQEVKGGFFGGVRHGSGERPRTTRTKTEKEQKSSDEDRKSSRRREETRDSKQPSLKTSKSTPPVTEARPPFARQRSHSMQDDQHGEEPRPSFKRAETMPPSPTTAGPPPREARRQDNSRLHPDSAGAHYPSPEPTPEAEPVKFRYGKDQVYADDGAFVPTPDGYVDATDSYRTQEYVPSRDTGRQSMRETSRSARYTRSPEPMKDSGERQSRRSSSARHTSQKPSMPRTTSTQYVVEPEGNSYVRPAPSRENSGRESLRNPLSRENSGRNKDLFNEIRTSGARSGSPRQEYSFPPPNEKIRYGPRYSEADVKVQSGYSRRQDDKPGYTRSGSGLHRAQTAIYA